MGEIDRGDAVTTYMHRSPASEGLSSNQGDVEPRRHGGQYYGSVFGVPSPDGAHVASQTAASPVSMRRSGAKRYYCDCAGFVRGLIQAAPTSAAAAAAAMGPLVAHAAPGVFGTPWATRAYPRAHVFADFFRSRSPICPSSRRGWYRVASEGEVRPGDVVAYGAPRGARHTGHIWVVTSTPDAQGRYRAIESTGGNGGGGVQRRTHSVGGSHFPVFVGRFVE